MAEDEGWKTSADSNLTVTEVTVNVIVLYLRNSNFFEDNFGKSFFEDNSIAIYNQSFCISKSIYCNNNQTKRFLENIKLK